MICDMQMSKSRVRVAAQKLGRFSVPVITTECQLIQKVVRPILREFVSDGFLVLHRTQPHHVYALADVTQLADIDDAILKTWEGRIWTAMRQFRKGFTPIDLRVSTPEPPTLSRVQGYCTMLAEASVLGVTRLASSGTPATYYLKKDLGPKPPIKRSVPLIYDANGGEFVNADRMFKP